MTERRGNGIGVSEGTGALQEHALLLMNSYRRWTGKELAVSENGKSLEETLFEAPMAILSHGTEADPVLNYGNRYTLKLWEMDWDTLTQMPSRLTAEPMEREERDRFFEKVSAHGFVDNYTGIRISASGRRFYILKATVWNLVDDEDRYRGQAACFSEYRYI